MLRHRFVHNTDRLVYVQQDHTRLPQFGLNSLVELWKEEACAKLLYGLLWLVHVSLAIYFRFINN